jgi:hypothetical protein
MASMLLLCSIAKLPSLELKIQSRQLLGYPRWLSCSPTENKFWRHDIQHNDTQHNDTQSKDTQHNEHIWNT